MPQHQNFGEGGRASSVTLPGSPGLRLSDEDLRLLLASSGPKPCPAAASGTGGDSGCWQEDTQLPCSRDGRRAPAPRILVVKGWEMQTQQAFPTGTHPHSIPEAPEAPEALSPDLQEVKLGFQPSRHCNDFAREPKERREAERSSTSCLVTGGGGGTRDGEMGFYFILFYF